MLNIVWEINYCLDSMGDKKNQIMNIYDDDGDLTWFQIIMWWGSMIDLPLQIDWLIYAYKCGYCKHLSSQIASLLGVHETQMACE